jgi:protein-S-isoprenylcysteine O-methyltransferase Ste14
MTANSLPPPWRTRWRVRAGYPLAIVFFLLARPTGITLACGAALAAAGLAVRGVSTGYLRKHEELSTTGPYSWTRNPLYLGSTLLGAGLLLAGASWISAALSVACFALFYPGVMRREEEELRAEYGVAFEEYARRVPLFWPRIPPARGTRQEGNFSWQQYRRNREYQALIGTLAAFALLAAKMVWAVR